MPEQPEVTICDCVPEEFRLQAAELYWLAFERKLKPALDDELRGVPFIAEQLNLDRCFGAVSEGKLLGVVGYQFEGKPAMGFSYRSMQSHYSVLSAPVRAALIAILGRNPKPGELLLDGICVAPAARGLGIGTKLLNRIIEFAGEQGLGTVRLSVIDSNPRARKLYERLGFKENGSVSMGILKEVYGFGRSTDLCYRLDSEAC